METLFNIDWRSMFVPTESILEVIIRGSIMYVGMFVLLRVFRRQAGSIGIADLLVIVVIADAAQNGMAGDSRSITEAMILIATIVVWDYVLDWLGFSSSLLSRLLAPQELLLIRNGIMLPQNMKKEMITEDELKSQLRQQGIEDITLVKRCYLESNGHFSVLVSPTGTDQQKGNESGPAAVN